MKKNLFNKEAVVERILPISVYTTNLGREISSKEHKAVEKYVAKSHLNEGKNWVSDNEHVLKDKTFKELNKFLQFHVENFLYKVIHADPKTKIYITQSWLNTTNQGESHHIHNHPNSYISGVFYFNANPETDGIDFQSTRKYQQVAPLIIKYTEDNSGVWRMPIFSGKLLLFQSFVEHSVIFKKDNYKRISLAFNTFIKGKLGKKDSLTELILK